jgi:hypothetical protein
MARSILLCQDANNGNSAIFDWDGGEGVLHAAGTWDGAKATLLYAPISPISGLSMAPSATDVELNESTPQKSFSPLPPGTVRVTIADGGGSESLTVVMARAK